MPRRWCLLIASFTLTGCAGTGTGQYTAQSYPGGPRPASQQPVPMVSNPQQKTLARNAERQGNLAEADRIYSQYVMNYPMDAEAWHRLGVVASQLQKGDSAGQYFKRAHDLMPGSADVLSDWGFHLQARGDYATAERWLAKAHEIRPQDQRICANLGTCIGMQGRIPEAESIFRKAFSASDTHYYIGQIHLKQGKNSLAQQSFRDALEANRDHKLSEAALAKFEGNEHRHQPPAPPVESDTGTMLAKNSVPPSPQSVATPQKVAPLPPKIDPMVAALPPSPVELVSPSTASVKPSIELATASAASTIPPSPALTNKNEPTVTRVSHSVGGADQVAATIQNVPTVVSLPTEHVPANSNRRMIPGPSDEHAVSLSATVDALPPSPSASLTSIGWSARKETNSAPQPLQQVAASPVEFTEPMNDQPEQSASWLEKHRHRIAARSQLSGFRGFCPVALRDQLNLVDGNAQHRVEFEGQTYALSSTEALVQFMQNPESYAPACGGMDPVSLRTQPQPGNIEHSVWYRGRLYLFTSEETLTAFKAAPKYFLQ